MGESRLPGGGRFYELLVQLQEAHEDAIKDLQNQMQHPRCQPEDTAGAAEALQAHPHWQRLGCDAEGTGAAHPELLAAGTADPQASASCPSRERDVASTEARGENQASESCPSKERNDDSTDARHENQASESCPSKERKDDSTDAKHENQASESCPSKEPNDDSADARHENQASENCPCEERYVDPADASRNHRMSQQSEVWSEQASDGFNLHFIAERLASRGCEADCADEGAIPTSCSFELDVNGCGEKKEQPQRENVKGPSMDRERRQRAMKAVTVAFDANNQQESSSEGVKLLRAQKTFEAVGPQSSNHSDGRSKSQKTFEQARLSMVKKIKSGRRRAVKRKTMRVENMEEEEEADEQVWEAINKNAEAFVKCRPNNASILAQVKAYSGCTGFAQHVWARWAEAWEKHKAHHHHLEDESCPHRIVEHSCFNLFCFVVILADTVWTAFCTNLVMETAPAGGKPTSEMLLIQVLFLIPYTTELILKLRAYGKGFFVGEEMKWNIFDMILVIQGVVDTVLDTLQAAQGANITFMRLLRLMKLGKIVRLFRALRFLRELRVMLMSIGMGGYLNESFESIDEATMLLIREYFGTVQGAVLSLYACASGGVSWKEVYLILSLCGTVYSTAFVFFIGFFNFAVLNILTGIFMEKALVAAQPDRDAMALEQRKTDEDQATELRHLLEAIDEDDSGTLSLDEFIAKSENEYVKAYFATLGLDIADANMFFRFLMSLSGKDELPIEEFIGRCFRMKGPASSLDLQGVAYEVDLIRHQVDILVDHLGHLNPQEESEK